jgi:protein O-mannosyl-transferase
MNESFSRECRTDLPKPLREKKERPAVGLFLLAILLLVVYWPGFQGQWFLDDFDNIHNNPNVHADISSLSSLAPAIYGMDESQKRIDRPLAYLTLAVNYAVGGTNPFGYHAVNFFIHLLTAAGLYILAYTTLGLPGVSVRHGRQAHAIALMGTLLWAVHPIQVTAVTYIIQRMAAMATLFSLLAMVCYAKGWTEKSKASRVSWFGLCGFSGLLAFGCKQNAIMLPVSLYLYHLVFFSNQNSRNRYGQLVLLSIAVLAIAGISVYYDAFGMIKNGYAYRPFTLAERLLTEPRVLFSYLWWMVYPVSAQFALLHDITISTGPWTPWTTLPSMALLIILAVVALVCRRKAPLLSYAWLFFLTNHIVESSVLPLELIFEHRNYLPGVFLFIVAGAGLNHGLNYFSKSRVVQPLLITGIIVVLASIGHTTQMRNVLFQNEIAFWKDNVEKSPFLHRPRHNLGSAYFTANRLENGIAATQRALSGKGLARTNQKQASHFNLAKFFLNAGLEETALLHYEKVLDLLPNHPSSLNAVARIMLNRGDVPSARLYNNRALRIEPENSNFLAIHGLILLRQGRTESAFREGIRAWEAQKNNPLAFFLLGEAARALGKLNSAAYFFRQSMALSPGERAPLFALIEIASIMNDPTQVRALVAALNCRVPQQAIGRQLAAYQRLFNFMDPARTERITEAIKTSFERLD